MKILKINTLSILLFFIGLSMNSLAQIKTVELPVLKSENPWNEKDLIEPAALSKILSGEGRKPMIFNIGVAQNIIGAKSFGGVSDAQNLENFIAALKKLPKDTYLVYYCGCCPFVKCPNIRPAYKALKSLGFTEAKLLNLRTNLKTDWIAKGYPISQ